jgi:hypothetical protein
MSTTRPGTPSAKAHRTAHWATTMTRWLIRHSTGGKRAGTRAVKLWQVIGFPGPNGRGSRGIVDLVAIRRDHSPLRSRVLQPGDLFEIVLIQVKGGTAPWPSPRYIKRLRAVQKRYGARGVVLAEWKKGREPRLYLLGPSWEPTSATEVFGAGMNLDRTRRAGGGHA